MAETRAQEYADKLQQMVDDATTLPAAARQAVLAQLRDASREITQALAKGDPSSFSSNRLRSLKAEIDRTMDSFAQQASADVARAQKQMYVDAAGNVNATVAIATQTTPVHTVIDTRAISIAQGYTADLVTGLSTETASKINNAIQRSALGGLTHQQLVEQIGGALNGGKFSGLFSETGARAEGIASNEILRIHSLASFTRIKDLSTRHNGLEKEWLHILRARVPRLTHIAASGQTRPVDEPFLVGGEALMYPRDPSGSAMNTIFCHCLLRAKLDPALLQPSDQERDLLKRYGISVTTHPS
jgi:hypothetical protein